MEAVDVSSPNFTGWITHLANSKNERYAAAPSTNCNKRARHSDSQSRSDKAANLGTKIAYESYLLARHSASLEVALMHGSICI